MSLRSRLERLKNIDLEGLRDKKRTWELMGRLDTPDKVSGDVIIETLTEMQEIGTRAARRKGNKR